LPQNDEESLKVGRFFVIDAAPPIRKDLEMRKSRFTKAQIASILKEPHAAWRELSGLGTTPRSSRCNRGTAFDTIDRTATMRP
jgi:hypothetical protein